MASNTGLVREDHTSIVFESLQGYPSQKGPITYGRRELEDLLRRSGFERIDWYLPFPDYKLPDVIINAQIPELGSRYFIYNWIGTPFPDRGFAKRLLLFNESLVVRELARSDLLPEFANSFLVLAYKGNPEDVDNFLGLSKSWVAKKYALRRAPCFRKCTVLVPGDPPKVIHQRIEEKFPKICKYKSVVQKIGEEEFVSGDLALFRIFGSIVRGDFEGELLQTLKTVKDFILNNFSTGLEEEGYPLVSGQAFDVTLFNLVTDTTDRQYHFIDREWNFTEFLPLDYVLFRNLLHLYGRFASYLPLKGRSIEQWIVETIQKIFSQYNYQRLTRNMEQERRVAALIANADVEEHGKTARPFSRLFTTPETNVSQEPLVSIVVVTYNSSRTIGTCLESLLKSKDDTTFELILVDNASRDNTVEVCKEVLENSSVPYKIIVNPQNRGFSSAVNQGVRESRGKYLVLLNPDVFVFPGWLSRLLQHFWSPEVGAVGPTSDYVAGLQKFQLYIDRGLSVRTFEYIDKVMATNNKRKSVETKLLIGFCLVVRKTVLEEVGLLDERLFLGNDDLDLSWHIRSAGYKLLVATDVFVHHEGQVSFRSEPPIKTKLLVQESTNYLFKKLREFYGENVPHPRELWGIDWFLPYRFLTSLIILTRNNLEYTRLCLESIRSIPQSPTKSSWLIMGRPMGRWSTSKINRM